jgi:hypothetical protein
MPRRLLARLAGEASTVLTLSYTASNRLRSQVAAPPTLVQATVPDAPAMQFGSSKGGRR